jgi:hypothetical protein
MATTTNYSWTTPDDTALVKDGASAIRTLGSSVDTTVKNLNPETTLGDLAYRSSTANVKTRLGLGTAGQFLAVNSGATAPEWQTLNAGGMTLISTTTLSGATTTLSSIPQTYNSLYLVVTGVTYNTSNKGFRLSPNDVTNLSNWLGVRTTEVASGADQTMYLSSGTDTLRTDADNIWTIRIDNYTSSTRYKTFNWVGSFLNTASARIVNFIGGVFRSNTAITSLVFDVERTNTFATGTVLLYGVK